ncbi:TPA: hypothetical protein ACFPVO_002140 [Neisseria meningitidis]
MKYYFINKIGAQKMNLDKQVKFKDFCLDGLTYDLSHLDAQVIEYEQPAKDDKKPIKYKFYVTYSMHCFTKDYDHYSQADRAKLMYKTSLEERPFCKVRYELSKKLPEIISNLASKKIGFAGYDNFANIEIFDEEKEKIIYYKVVFTVYRHEKKFRLHVISAYPIDNWEKLKPVGFFKLAHNLVKGKKLPTPQK